MTETLNAGQTKKNAFSLLIKVTVIWLTIWRSDAMRCP